MIPTRVLIVGAGGALGRAVAHQLANEGAHLLLVDLNREGLKRTEVLLDHHGYHAIDTLMLDVGCADAVDRLESWFDRTKVTSLDRFVYAAGITGPIAQFGEYPASAFEEVIRVNLIAPFTLLSALLSRLANGSSPSAVLIGSTSSIRGRSGLSGYVSSKHGLLGLVKSAALDLAEGPIRLNAVLPGPIDTPMLQQLNETANQNGQSFGRASGNPTSTATPEEVANVIRFLLSPDASHVHGAGWVVDNGGTVG